ncbi:MAG TPA: hypothetical protein VM577_13770, partial [Anaerovoracaceae bacterium]|nr:hypothetical protein [Anaerovoracaceae bacterium]
MGIFSNKKKSSEIADDSDFQGLLSNSGMKGIYVEPKQVKREEPKPTVAKSGEVDAEGSRALMKDAIELMGLSGKLPLALAFEKQEPNLFYEICALHMNLGASVGNLVGTGKGEELTLDANNYWHWIEQSKSAQNRAKTLHETLTVCNTATSMIFTKSFAQASLQDYMNAMGQLTASICQLKMEPQSQNPPVKSEGKNAVQPSKIDKEGVIPLELVESVTENNLANFLALPLCENAKNIIKNERQIFNRISAKFLGLTVEAATLMAHSGNSNIKDLLVDNTDIQEYLSILKQSKYYANSDIKQLLNDVLLPSCALAIKISEVKFPQNNTMVFGVLLSSVIPGLAEKAAEAEGVAPETPEDVDFRALSGSQVASDNVATEAVINNKKTGSEKSRFAGMKQPTPDMSHEDRIALLRYRLEHDGASLAPEQRASMKQLIDDMEASWLPDEEERQVPLEETAHTA